MLGWLSSKMATALAVLLLISSVTAYFVKERREQERNELQIIARGLARFIGETIGLGGTAELIVCSSRACDFVLPERIGGNQYGLNARSDSVIVEQSGRIVLAQWSGTLHFWSWSGKRLSNATVEALDQEASSLSVRSGETLLVSLERIEMDDSEPIFAFARRTG